MSPFENADYSESSSEASINNISGLDFGTLANNEIIKKTSDTTAEGSGVTITDTETTAFPQNIITKSVSFFNRASPLNIQLGENFFRYTFAGYNQRIVPYKQVLTTGTNGLYLHHFPALNNSNVRVGVNIELPAQDFQVGTTLYVDDTNKKVGIGITNPEEELEVDGSIQIDSANVARLKFQKSGGSPHALGEVDAEEDPVGGNGGDLQFFTKVNGGSVTEKLRINNVGCIGIGGANFGTNGQVLTSRGNSLPPVWTDKVRITRFRGTNNTASGAAGVVHSIIFNPSGWVQLRPDNTFCEEYGATGSGSSSATRDGSIKILETGTYMLSTKFVLICSTLGFDLRGRVMKIPAAGGSPIFIGQTQLLSYINPLGSPNDYVISRRIATTVEVEELVVGDRILLQMFAQGAAVTGGTNTQIIIEKIED